LSPSDVYLILFFLLVIHRIFLNSIAIFSGIIFNGEKIVGSKNLLPFVLCLLRIAGIMIQPGLTSGSFHKVSTASNRLRWALTYSTGIYFVFPFVNLFFLLLVWLNLKVAQQE
jgi:hypothetical protein